jgi:hypothetical protein
MDGTTICSPSAESETSETDITDIDLNEWAGMLSLDVGFTLLTFARIIQDLCGEAAAATEQWPLRTVVLTHPLQKACMLVNQVFKARECVVAAEISSKPQNIVVVPLALQSPPPRLALHASVSSYSVPLLVQRLYTSAQACL